MMLKTKTNTPAIERRILAAAGDLLGEGRRIEANFEHGGQWWVTDCDTGAEWSVVDAVGGRAVDGFDFEQVTQGDEG
jgi:hypothetical protein